MPSGIAQARKKSSAINHPPLRFFIRAALLLIAMLFLWDAVLLDPLRTGLLFSSTALIWFIPGGGSPAASILPNGNWSLRLPVPAAIGSRSAVQQMFQHRDRNSGPVRVRSLTVIIEDKYPVLFTAGLPFFWALVLASGWRWNRALPLLKGSGALFAIATVSLVFYIISTALKTLHLPAGAVGSFLNSGTYLVINVVPYVTPMVAALYLDLDLRRQVFSESSSRRQDFK
jgi:hypothetical protein